MIRVNGESIKKIILMGGKRWSSADFSHKLVSTVNTEDHARAHDPQWLRYLRSNYLSILSNLNSLNHYYFVK